MPSSSVPGELLLKVQTKISRVEKQMEGHSGRQVLGLQREALEVGGPGEDDHSLQAAFGKEEGGRLDSQIILSRNQTKYTQGE